MSAIRGSAHSKYPGLLPIEPRDDFLCPIDLEPEPIDLKPERIDLTPENVLFPNWEPSTHKRPRALARFPIAFCTGVAGAWLWLSYGDAAREMIANSYWQLGWPAPRPAPTAQNHRPTDVIGLAAPAAPSAKKLNAMSFDLDAVGPNKIATTIAAGETATSVDQAPAARASDVIVESQGDEVSLQPTMRLNIKPTEAKPPEALSEKGKPLASCFASASAVLQNHPGGWPTWTLRAPGHEGTVCWYAAARPRGSNHRDERVARKDMVGTAEHELFAPVAPRGRGGSWEGGLP
jgi:hypothetical protein